MMAGHATTNWIDDDPASATYGQKTVHPVYEALTGRPPDRNDARHLFQADRNGVRDVITTDRRTVLSRASAIREATGLSVWSPAEYVSKVIGSSP